MTNLEKLLAEVRELDEKATPGPYKTEDWRKEEENCVYLQSHDGTVAEFKLYCDDPRPTTGDDLANAQFASRARTLLPKLAEIISEWKEQLALMAEGEGPDGYVYEEMAKAAWKKAEEIAEC